MLLAWDKPDPVEEIKYFTVYISPMPPLQAPETIKVTSVNGYNIGELMTSFPNGIYKVEVTGTNEYGFESEVKSTPVFIYWYFRPSKITGVRVVFP